MYFRYPKFWVSWAILSTAWLMMLSVGHRVKADPKPSIPTQEEIATVQAAVAKLGGNIVDWPVKTTLDWGVGDVETASAKITTLQFQNATDDILAQLPVIPFPFGLSASGPNFTDKGLKALANQKNLKQLDLNFATKVTGGGLVDLPQLEALGICNGKFDAAKFGALGKAQSLRYLRLLRVEVGDEAMKEVGQLTSLQVLEMHGNGGLTDDGVASLKGLTELTDLDLSGTSVKGETLDELQKATRLKRLHLANTALTDEGMKRIAKLTNLKRLQVGFNRGVSDVGVNALKPLKHLESLSLDVTKVTDGGLETVGSLNKLIYLNLWSTEVSDAGLKHLTGLEGLLFLRADQTKVTPKGLEALHKSLPNLLK